MFRTLSACLLAFTLLLAALPCLAADLEAACAKFHSCYNGGGHDVCWKRHESQLLSKRDAKASRDGASLHVMTLRGSVIFTDTLDEFKHVEGGMYRYLGYYPDIQQHLVGIIYYEGNNYALVSYATAAVVYTGDIPRVSSSRKRIVVADSYRHPGVDTVNMIEIWTLEGGSLRKEYSEPSQSAWSRFVRWEDDESFTVDEYALYKGSICPEHPFPPKQHYTYSLKRGILSKSVAKKPNFRCGENDY